MSKVAIVTGAGQWDRFCNRKTLASRWLQGWSIDYNAETAGKAVAELSAENALQL